MGHAPLHTLGVIGVPTSAGAFAPGQEQAPAALRAAGLVEALRAGGATVTDHGDREPWRWRPDRQSPRAQNVGTVVEIVRDTARRVAAAASQGELTLVLGGDCTVGIGTVAGHVASGERVGLLYLDSHADLNVPDRVPEGAIDWMGVAHMLGEEGAEPALVAVGSCTPLLSAEQIVLVGWGARLVVHFDVDVIDFTDVPLSENTGRNQGLAFDAALRAFATLVSSPKLAGVTISELNPDHTEQGAGTLERFARAVAAALSGREP
jgi:arginase